MVPFIPDDETYSIYKLINVLVIPFINIDIDKTINVGYNGIYVINVVRAVYISLVAYNIGDFIKTSLLPVVDIYIVGV